MPEKPGIEGFFFFSGMYVYVCRENIHLSEGVHGGPKRVLDPCELQVEVAVSLLWRLLGMERRSPARAVHVLNP